VGIGRGESSRTRSRQAPAVTKPSRRSGSGPRSNGLSWTLGAAGPKRGPELENYLHPAAPAGTFDMRQGPPADPARSGPHTEGVLCGWKCEPPGVGGSTVAGARHDTAVSTAHNLCVRIHDHARELSENA